MDLSSDWVPELALKSPARADNCLLVVFFGDATWQWVKPENVHDFAAHFTEHAGANVRGSRQLFLSAVQEAKDMMERRAAAAAGGAAAAPMPQIGASEAAPAALGAPRASLRCGECRTCKASAHKPCLLVDATRLAAAGHVGAALTALGTRAKGVRIEVFWPLDDRYYSGVVTDFDKYSCYHRVLYDDDEAELVALWKETVACDNVPAKGAAQPVSVAQAQQLRVTVAPVPLAPPPPLMLASYGHITASALTPGVATPAGGAATTAQPAAPPTRGVAARTRTLSFRAADAAADAATSAAVIEADEGEAVRAKRRRNDKVVNYATFFNLGPLPSRSRRCVMCKTQKKGTCGTPTSSRLCLLRTPDMPLRREVVPATQRRGNRRAGSLPVLPGTMASDGEEDEDVEGVIEPARAVPWARVPGYIAPPAERRHV